MLRSTLFLLCLPVLLLTGSASGVAAQEEWVRAGSYLDWPDTLRNDRPLSWISTASRSLPTAFSESLETDGDGVDPAAALVLIPDTDILPGQSLATAGVCTYDWQMLPEGLLYHSYLAGEKEPRFASQWLSDKERGKIWEAAVGGRWGLVRHGTYGVNGEGFQFDVEGAAFARIDPEEEADLEAADFRAGFIGTWRYGPWRYKAGYYHISSHIGDEYLIRNPGFQRINYVRDSLIVGTMYDWTDDIQLYGEIGAALNHNGGAELLELQFGAQYSPAVSNGFHGSPFAAINGHLRQEFDFGGSVNMEAGWQWRGAASNHLLRVGFQHFNGPSMQYSLFDEYESLTGAGIWYDF